MEENQRRNHNFSNITIETAENYPLFISPNGLLLCYNVRTIYILEMKIDISCYGTKTKKWGK